MRDALTCTFHKKSTGFAILLLLVAGACGEARKDPDQRGRTIRNDANDKDLPRAVPRDRTSLGADELRYRVFPWIVRAESISTPSADRALDGLLRFDSGLGLAIIPRIREGGHFRDPSPEEIAKVDALGVPRGTIYRDNLARLLREASLLSIGEPGGNRFLYLDTALAGVEALILLPEVWQRATSELAQEPMLVLPDRAHCRFLPAGPTRVFAAMAKDLDAWNRQGSAPLASQAIWLDGEILRGWPPFARFVDGR